MKKKSKIEKVDLQEKNAQSDLNTSTLSTGQKFLKELREQGYDNSRVGQAFVMPFTKPRKDNQKPEAFKK